MNKKKRTLIIGAIVLVLLVGVLVFLLLTQDQATQGDESSSESTAEETFPLVEENVDDFTSLEMTNASDSYVMTSSGEGEDKTYEIAELKGYPEQDSNYSYAAETLSSLDAGNKVLDTVEDKAKYGLDEPSATAKVSYGDKTYTLYLGDATPEESDGYYFMMEGDNALYTVSSSVGTLMLQDKFYYLNRDMTQSYTNTDEEQPEVNKVTVTRKDMEEPIVLEKTELASDGTNSLYMSTMKMTSPVECDMDYELDSNYISTLFGLSAQKVLGFYNEADAAQYGFDDPEYTLEMEYEGGNTTIIVGDALPSEEEDTEGSEYHYAICDDNGLVYRFDVTKIGLTKVDLNDVISKMPLVPLITDVEQIDLTIDGTEYQFTLKHTAAESEDEEDQLEASCNGQVLDEENFRLFYQLLVGMSIEELNTEPVTTEPLSEVTLVYHYNNGESDDTLVAKEVENRRLRVNVNGEDRFEGRAAYLDKLSQEIQNLLNGETVDTSW